MNFTPIAFATLFERGGVVMWPLLACSLTGITVALERAFVFARFHRQRAAGEAEVRAMLADLQQGDTAGAISRGLNNVAGPIAGVLAEGLQEAGTGLGESLQMSASRLLNDLRRGLSLLDTIITLGPLLGILGTVTGIIRSFHLLSSAGVQDPTAVTGGIAEALLTTAAGLIVAILALLPFNFFVAQLKRYARHLEQLSHRCEVAYQQGQVRQQSNGSHADDA